MKALFDNAGKVHALSHPSDKPGAPVLQFVPPDGRLLETFELPVELQDLKPEQLHAAVYVEHNSGKPTLVKRS